MTPKILLAEPLHEHLKTVKKRGEIKPFVWVVKIGPIVKICPSEKSATGYLEKLGYRLNENVQWELKYKSDGEFDLEKNYRIIY